MLTARFEDIGPIKKAELELGDLTIIAEQNNTGKTYLAHTLYNFLNFWEKSEFNLFHEFKYPKKYEAKIKEIVKQVRKTGSAEITLDEYDYMSHYLFKAISELFSKEFLHRSFSSSKKELDYTRNRLVQELQNSWDTEDVNPFEFTEKRSACYAAPMQNNISFIRDLPHIVKQKSELPTDAVSLLKNIVGGDYKVEKDVIKFISNKRGKNRFEIPLHLASSLVCGLPGLYFYLKHSADKEDLLIMDEPESYLSPRNQILMARLLALCVNNGIRVLITTHSDYIVKEINNLIMLHQDFEGKQEFLKKYKEYTENDCLDPNSVKAYICEEGGLSSCDINERGIKEMSVFDDAIDDINLMCGELNYFMDKETLEDD